MGIRVRLTEDVAGWRAGSRLGFADDRAAEDILGKGTFVVYDPAPAVPEPEPQATAPAATEEPAAPVEPETVETPADTFVGEPADTFVGEPAETFVGEPAETFVGEPAETETA